MQYDENMRVASRTRERRERVAPHTAEKKTQPRHQGVETSVILAPQRKGRKGNTSQTANKIPRLQIPLCLTLLANAASCLLPEVLSFPHEERKVHAAPTSAGDLRSEPGTPLLQPLCSLSPVTSKAKPRATEGESAKPCDLPGKKIPEKLLPRTNNRRFVSSHSLVQINPSHFPDRATGGVRVTGSLTVQERGLTTTVYGVWALSVSDDNSKHFSRETNRYRLVQSYLSFYPPTPKCSVFVKRMGA